MTAPPFNGQGGHLCFLPSKGPSYILKNEKGLKGVMKALVFNDFGGPEVLSVREVAEPERSKSAVIAR